MTGNAYSVSQTSCSAGKAMSGISQSRERTQRRQPIRPAVVAPASPEHPWPRRLLSGSASRWGALEVLFFREVSAPLHTSPYPPRCTESVKRSVFSVLTLRSHKDTRTIRMVTRCAGPGWCLRMARRKSNGNRNIKQSEKREKETMRWWSSSPYDVRTKSPA